MGTFSLAPPNAKGFPYRVRKGLGKRAVRDVHLAHVRVEPDDEVILLTNRGRGWKGMVGFVPAEGGDKGLGLERGEQVIALAVLRPEAYLVLGTQGARVKRTHIADLSLPDRTWGAVMGVGDEDELLFGDVAGDGAHVLFYTAKGQLLRLDGDAINPQQTGTAAGVAGIKVTKGDRLLGGAVVSNAESEGDKWQVMVVSETGYMHRSPLSAFSVKGRGSQGMRCLRPTKSDGAVGSVTVGQRGAVDVYLADGRRQRLALEEIPATARDALGRRMVEAGGKATVARVVLLS